MFEYVASSNKTGYVAIDDIQFLQFACTLQPPEAGQGIITTVMPTTTVSTTRAPIPAGPYNCDFDTDLCSYQQVI